MMYSLTQSGIGCFIAVRTHMATVGVKGLKIGRRHSCEQGEAMSTPGGG